MLTAITNPPGPHAQLGALRGSAWDAVGLRAAWRLLQRKLRCTQVCRLCSVRPDNGWPGLWTTWQRAQARRYAGQLRCYRRSGCALKRSGTPLPSPKRARSCSQHPECWLKKALAVKHASVSLDTAAERPPVEQRGAQLPLLRAPDIEARVGVGLGWERP